MEFTDLKDSTLMFEREKTNLLRIGKIAAAALGGCVIFGPLTFLAAPGIASALGALGLLGAAKTGTAITTLGGIALSNASLAAIGGGSMLTGISLITAIGTGLGAWQGGVVSNRYFSEIEGFEIDKIRSGPDPALVFVNGFLSEKEQLCSDWSTGTEARFPNNSRYYVKWESKTLYSLGSMLAKDAAGRCLAKYAAKLAMKASKQAGSKLNPLNWASLVADLLANPWHVANVKAQMTGVLLADLLARTKNTEFILMGHSLGCLVIHYALNVLATRKGTTCVRDVYLFGGAVDRLDEAGWNRASEAVDGHIHNCYSDNDGVLSYLYRPATGFIADPIGLGPIICASDRIRNWNVTPTVGGHMDYKCQLKSILEVIRANCPD